MKKKLSFFLAFLILLTGCSTAEPPAATTAETEITAATENTTKASETTTSATTTTAATTTVTTTTAKQTIPAEKLPAMDGSTSAIPLEAGLKSELLGVPYNKAKELVSHTKTHESFQRLLSGEVDLIFSVPISEEQQKMADETGVTLKSVPVAKEGFVFVVNADNPVDSLTTQQIKDIYSGKITNWSELGGNDLPILAYQRNTDSGSQNYMTEFMGDTPLKKPESKYIAVGMGGLIDAIATYDNSEGAIGYSVYSYAAQMYANANQVKFIAVDGVEPTKATMADESYPLSSCTYIIYPDNADKNTIDFVNWAVSEEGQEAVLKSGYLPVNGMEIPESYLPYDAVGTGEAKPADYVPYKEYSAEYFDYKNGIKLSGYDYTKDNYYQIYFLKDKDLQDKINADIRAATDSLKPYYDDKYLEIGYNWNDVPLKLTKGVSIYTVCRNGYLSILLGYCDYSREITDPISYSYMYSYDYAVSLNYDLFTGEKIDRLSDLFYEGVDFVPALNNAVSEFIATDYLPSTGVSQKIDFSGLLGTPEVFTIDRICLPKDNAYFYDSPYLVYNFDERIYDLSVVGKFRDMSGLFTAEYSSHLYKYIEWEQDHFVENGLYIPYITSSRYHNADEIKERNELYYKAYTKAAEVFKNQLGYDFSDNEWPQQLRMSKRAGAYYLTTGFVATDLTVWLDVETLEPLEISDILGENWLDYSSGEYGSGQNCSLVYYRIIEDDILEANVMYEHEENVWGFDTLSIPMSEVNEKYIGEYEFY